MAHFDGLFGYRHVNNTLMVGEILVRIEKKRIDYNKLRQVKFVIECV